MKKIISLLLTIIMLLSSFCFTMSAYATSDELDLSQYTVDDLAQMSADEFRQLLADFERVYDPFDTLQYGPNHGGKHSPCYPATVGIW